jgi:DNA helicase IV
VEAALGSGGSVNSQRMRFRRAVARVVTATLTERRQDIVVDNDEVAADLRKDRQWQSTLNRIWPAQSAAALIRALLGPGALLGEAGGDLLSAEERRILRRAAKAHGWTEADLPLLDEADAQLSDPPRRYGYIVVDEAQDLSAMALRMVARRSADGRSMTILGDPGSSHRPWCAAGLGEHDRGARQPGACVEELLTGYRVPRQIMDLANRVLAVSSAPLPTTVSVRVGDEDPRFERVGPRTGHRHRRRVGHSAGPILLGRSDRRC